MHTSSFETVLVCGSKTYAYKPSLICACMPLIVMSFLAPWQHSKRPSFSRSSLASARQRKKFPASYPFLLPSALVHASRCGCVPRSSIRNVSVVPWSFCAVRVTSFGNAPPLQFGFGCQVRDRSHLSRFIDTAFQPGQRSSKPEGRAEGSCSTSMQTPSVGSGAAMRAFARLSGKRAEILVFHGSMSDSARASCTCSSES